MKKIIVVTLFVISSILTMSAQKIAKDEIDKFTKQRVIETKQEELIKRNKWKNIEHDIFARQEQQPKPQHITAENTVSVVKINKFAKMPLYRH